VLIGELNGKLPEEEEKVAPLQRKKSSPSTEETEE
jgi:hypothetical protein